MALRDPIVTDPFRKWALDNVARAKDDIACKDHPDGFEYATCVVCAFRLGRAQGHMDAGAYYTEDEVFGSLRGGA